MLQCTHCHLHISCPMSYEPSCFICTDLHHPNHCITVSPPRNKWIRPPQKQQYHSQRTRSRHAIHSKLQYVVVPTYSSKCNASFHWISLKHCIFHTTIWFLWRLSLPHWLTINKQIPWHTPQQLQYNLSKTKSEHIDNKWNISIKTSYRSSPQASLLLCIIT